MALHDATDCERAMSQKELEALVDEFSAVLVNDPGPLSPELPTYVPGLHGTGADDQTALLARQIRLSEGGHLYYFSGMRGTGKSTELRRLEIELNGRDDTRAYLVDALEFMGETHPIDTLDLLLVVAAAFAHRLSQDDALGEDLLQPDGPFKRFATWLQTEVGLDGIDLNGIKLTFQRQQQSIVERIRAHDRERQERVMAECQAFVEAMADAVRARLRRRKIVLIVDSLERLRSVTAGSSEMFDRVIKVFYGDEKRLRIPGVQMVFSVPPYLPYLSNVKALVRFFMLASVRVCEPPGVARRQRRPGGMAGMESLVARRFTRWQEVLTQGALHRLIFESGGDIRQLLRRLLVNTLDRAAFDTTRLPLRADDAIVQEVIAAQRTEFRSLVVQAEYPLLKRIAQSNAIELPRRQDMVALANFFDQRAVLNYRNGEDWLDLNPLLWPLIDDWQPPAPDANPASSGA